MRLPEPAIRAAILYSEEEVRLTAATYFSGSSSQDEAVMTLVVRAVELYGREKAFRLLRSAESLAQTQATVDWLLSELRRDYDLADVDEDNYRFAVALILYHAGPGVLLQRNGFIDALSMFPDQLRRLLDRRLDMLSWDWNRGWAALEALGRHTLRKGRFAWNDVLRAACIFETLVRNCETKAATLLRLLRRQYDGGSEALMEWLQPLLVRLAGAMRLAPAIPVIVEHLPDDNLNLADESTTALIKIGGDAVVAAIAEQWASAGTPFRAAAADVLENIHTDLCAELCLEFFRAEEDPETKHCLAHAVLSQFVDEGIEAVRPSVLGHDAGLSPDSLDLRYRLVAVCTVMGESFPEFEQWREDAVASHWGLGDYQPPRLADGFPLIWSGPKRPRSGKPRPRAR